MKFSITFNPNSYGKKPNTIIVEFESELEMKLFYKGCESDIIDYSVIN